MGRSLFLGEADNFVEFLELVSETSYSFIVMPLSVMDFQYVQDLLLDKAGVVVEEQQPAVEARIKECAKAFGFDSDQVFVAPSFESLQPASPPTRRSVGRPDDKFLS